MGIASCHNIGQNKCHCGSRGEEAGTSGEDRKSLGRQVAFEERTLTNSRGLPLQSRRALGPGAAQHRHRGHEGQQDTARTLELVWLDPKCSLDP